MKSCPYTVTLDYEEVDFIVKDVLKKDYLGLCKDANILSAIENKDRVENEDLKFNRRIIEAMRIVGEYYFSEEEQKEIFGA